MRAILINPATQTVEPVMYDGNWKSIAPMIHAASGLFDIVRVGESTDMYVDDEGLLIHPNPNGYFMWADPGNFRGRVPMAGCALLLGHDDEGDACDVDVTPQWVRERVIWSTLGRTN